MRARRAGGAVGAERVERAAGAGGAGGDLPDLPDPPDLPDLPDLPLLPGTASVSRRRARLEGKGGVLRFLRPECHHDLLRAELFVPRLDRVRARRQHLPRLLALTIRYHEV